MDKMKINDILSWCDLSLCTAIWLDHERPRISDALMYVVMGVQVWFKVHAIRDFRGKIEFIGLPLRNRKLEVLEVYRLGLNNRFIMKTSVKIHKRLQIIDNWLTLIGYQKGWDCFEAISRVLGPASDFHNIHRITFKPSLNTPSSKVKANHSESCSRSSWPIAGSFVWNMILPWINSIHQSRIFDWTLPQLWLKHKCYWDQSDNVLLKSWRKFHKKESIWSCIWSHSLMKTLFVFRLWFTCSHVSIIPSFNVW